MKTFEDFEKIIQSEISEKENTKILLERSKASTERINLKIQQLSELKQVVSYLKNDKALQIAKCNVCACLYVRKAKGQSFCSDRCRIANHRAKHDKEN